MQERDIRKALRQDIEKGLSSLEEGKAKPLNNDLIDGVKRKGRALITGCDENSQDIPRR